MANVAHEADETKKAGEASSANAKADKVDEPTSGRGQ